MKRFLTFVAIAIAAGSFPLVAQTKTNAGVPPHTLPHIQDVKAAPAPVGVQGVSVGLPFYTVDDAFRLTIRELEHKSDQLQKDNLAMKLKIKENEAEDAAIWSEIRRAGSKYAEEKKIDPARYDFDAADVKYPQKKKP